MRYHLLAIALAALAYFSTAGFAASPEELDPDQVLRAYEQYVASVRTLSFHSRIDSRLKGHENEATDPQLQAWKIDFRRKRLWCSDEDSKTVQRTRRTNLQRAVVRARQRDRHWRRPSHVPRRGRLRLRDGPGRLLGKP